jgi:predicted phosphodiesterase
MRLGVIADIHGNAPALQAVLEELTAADVDSIVCLGDIVGVLGSPNTCVTLVRENAAWSVVGNHDAILFPETEWNPVHDHEVVEYEESMETLTDSNYAWLHELPPVETILSDVTIAHARPDGPDPIGHSRGNAGIRARDAVEEGSRLVDGGVLLVGHTHHQHAVVLDRFEGQSGLLLNPGSVGFPFDHSTDSEGTSQGKASFAIVDTETKEYELGSVLYGSSTVVSYLDSHDLRDK